MPVLKYPKMGKKGVKKPKKNGTKKGQKCPFFADKTQ